MSESLKLPRGPATYADLEALPENVIGELIDGELFTSPRPSSLHAIAEAGFVEELRGRFQSGRGGPGGWWILPEPELRLGTDVLVPDLAGSRRERLPEKPTIAHFTLVPDWVCEILSPSNALLDRVKKLPKYAEHGVRHLWLADPAPKTLDAFVLENGRWSLLKSFVGGIKATIPPFDAIEIDLAVVWGDLPLESAASPKN